MLLKEELCDYIRGCTQKFPDWPPEARTVKCYSSLTLGAVLLAILRVSLVSFAATTLCVAPQRVFIYFVMTQSGNFWIHPRT